METNTNGITYGDLANHLNGPDESVIQDEEVWAVINSFFEQNGLNSSQLHSFNDFIHHGVQSVLDIENIKHTKIEDENGRTYLIEFGEVIFTSPKFTELNGESHPLYPTEALWRNITYAAEMYVDITIVPPSGESSYYEKIHLGNIPVMVHSDLCNLALIANNPEEIASHSEDMLDRGGYFVIAPKSESCAQRRVLVSQEKIATNRVFIFKNRKSNPKFDIYVECHSTLTGTHTTTTTVGRIQNRISCLLPWIDGVEIPVGVLFRAFGIEDEQTMMILILGPKFRDDKNAMDVLIPVLEYSYECSSQDAALHFIGRRGRKFMKDDTESEGFSSDGSSEPPTEEKFARQIKDRDAAISYAKHLLSMEVLSHVGQGEQHFRNKAMFLGYMIKKLLYVILGYRKPENRDHYMNKRINTTGVLLKQQFHGAMRRLIMEITNNVHKALRQGHNVNITSWIKSNIITNAMQGAISNNSWNTGGAKAKGISQIYEQYNYAAGIANMRKVTLPIDAEGGKITEPRDLQSPHFGIMCVTGDTKIMLANGSFSRIDKINNNTKVMTVDPNTLKMSSSGITNFFMKMPKELLCIETDSGMKLKCTPDHPILEVTGMYGDKSWQKWTRASDLNVENGNLIVTFDDNTIVYRSIVKITQIPPEHVYDFTTISENHSFIANGIVTHNCPSETPEGKKVGLVRNMALMCYITIGSDSKPIIDIIKNIIGSAHLDAYPESLDWATIFVNGTPVGSVREYKNFIRTMIKLRRSANIHPETSIAYYAESHEIHISTEPGRPCRPLIVVDDGEVKIKLDTIKALLIHELTWSQLLATGVVELIDTAEQEEANIIGYPSDLNTLPPDVKLKITHCEMHPSMIYGIGGSIIAFPDHNQSPRNTYQSAMGKQAVGIPFTNYRQIMSGTFQTMRYLQRPIALSRAASIIGFDDLPAGQNAMTIIMPRIYNEEDSMEINADSISRGFMVTDKWTCYHSERRKEHGEFFGVPTEETCERFRGNPGKLNEEGFVPRGTKVENGDILIGKLIEIKQDASSILAGKKKKYINVSVKYEHTWPAVVDRIQIGRTGDGYQYISVMVVQERVPIVGDKFCYTPDHEVLTTSGWIPISMLKYEHKVATLNTQTHELEYQHPTEITSFDHNGDIVRVSSNQVQLKVTFNHKMYVKQINHKSFQLTEMKNIYGKGAYFKRNAKWNGIDLDEFVIPGSFDKDSSGAYFSFNSERRIYMNDWLILFGIWLTSGVVRNNAIYLYLESITQELMLELKNVLYKIDAIYTQSHNTIIILDTGIYSILSKLYIDGKKIIPDWAWNLSTSQSLTLLSSMCLGNSNGDDYFCNTSSTDTKDHIMRLALHCGYYADALLSQRLDREFDPYRMETNFNKIWKIFISKTNAEPLVNHVKNEHNIIRYSGAVYCCTVPNHIMYVRNTFGETQHGVWCGNSARHGQKGTAGKLVRAIDLPFNSMGIAPDIIVNSLAFPSRMTIAMLIEMWAGKAVTSTSALHSVLLAEMVNNETDDLDDWVDPDEAYDGEISQDFKAMFSHPKHPHLVDATPFRKFDRNVIKNEMSNYGLSLGDEYWTDGVTGKPIRCLAFFGPCYYQRLKHQVVDKIHARAKGPRNTLTRQPKEGRAFQGGLRTGTMERDCILAQGASRFARDRLMEQSDEFRMWVCNTCGLPAHTEQEGQIRECRMCGTTDVSKIRIPYGTKLIMQELMGENIVPRTLVTQHSIEVKHDVHDG